jgi:hypothetical protein
MDFTEIGCEVGGTGSGLYPVVDICISCVEPLDSTASRDGWQLRSHITHIKIFADGCSSIQFNWINKNTILL